ncbi:PaaI family thioesterase [Yunchengibacter salinarum]|uniref:PaaI family thioesterase n=1 Tax=Yunchengibacter salinarum TaxID=3133399 RepID=UPI0035B5D8EF
MAAHDPRLPEGFRPWGDTDPFEQLVGPFYLRRKNDGTHEAAMMPEPRHCNAGGMLHGGLLMSFADYALFVIARHALKDDLGVTVTFDSQFIAPARPDAVLMADGAVVRATGSLIFVRGAIRQDESTVLTINGIVKRIRKTL